MKFAIFITLFFAFFSSCDEQQPMKLSIDDDIIWENARNYQYESFLSSKDSSCIEVITFDQIKAHEEITIKLGNYCDSVEISIPPGGTITSAELYVDSILENPIAKVPGFAIGEFISNHFTVSSKLRGRYFLDYRSCHIWHQLWLNFE